MTTLSQTIKQEKEKLQKEIKFCRKNKINGESTGETIIRRVKGIETIKLNKAKLQTLSDIEAQIKEKVGDTNEELKNSMYLDNECSLTARQILNDNMGDFE